MSARPVSKKRSSVPRSAEEKKRTHIEKMLLRSKKNAARALKLVGKWEGRLAATKPSALDQRQAALWQDQN